jgi:hypothetical protein
VESGIKHHKPTKPNHTSAQICKLQSLINIVFNKEFHFCKTFIHFCIPYLGLHNAHPLLALKISRKKLVRVYNAHGLSKKIAVGNVRIKYQSYIFFSPLSMFHMLGEFKNHLSLFIFNEVAKC